MKLNPFSKKTTSGYYARIKAEHADVKQQLDTLQTAAAEARADSVAKEKYAFDLEQRGSHHSVSEAERRARREAGEAKQRADALERDVRDLKAKFHDLRSIVEAPDKLESARIAPSPQCAADRARAARQAHRQAGQAH
jgi:predicted nuclease with TOPRIM domain